MEILKYTNQDKKCWNEFVKQNQHFFLFDRNFMDYHSHKFNDVSLMIRKDGHILAIMPANLKGKQVFSHQGLSFGGVLFCNQIKTQKRIEILQIILKWLKNQGFTELIYKAPPLYQKTNTQQEDIFFLQAQKHSLALVEFAAVRDLKKKLPYHKRKIRNLKKSNNAIFQVVESQEWQTAWNILNERLQERYHTAPVHSLKEILLLKNRFPAQIKLFAIYKNSEMLAATVIFVHYHSVHAQYIAANEAGRKCSALDRLFHVLFEKYTLEGKTFFSLGVSTNRQEGTINWGLANWKEEFAAYPMLHQTYHIEL